MFPKYLALVCVFPKSNLSKSPKPNPNLIKIKELQRKHQEALRRDKGHRSPITPNQAALISGTRSLNGVPGKLKRKAISVSDIFFK